MTLDADTRAVALVRSAWSSDVRRARTLLAVDPALARHDIACACVTGEAGEVAQALERAPELAGQVASPLGQRPIVYACFSRLLRTEPDRAPGIREVVRLLLEAGADPNASFEHEGWLQVPLYGSAGIANDVELTRMLLAAGADPNDGNDAHTVGEALYHACEFADPTCAMLLIDAGTKPEVVDYCLGRALNFPNDGMVEMFCAHGAHPWAAHLHQAVWRRRSAATVRALLDAGAPVDEPDEHGLTALRIATRWGSDEGVLALLRERGADEGLLTDEDRALGAFLAHGGAPPASSAGLDEMVDIAICAGDVPALRRLLDAGAALDRVEGREHEPIGEAAWRGKVEIVRELVARGARVVFPGGGSAIGAALHGSRHCHHPEGGPMMCSIEEIPRERYAEIVRLLLAAGAPIPDAVGESRARPAMLIADLGVELS